MKKFLNISIFVMGSILTLNAQSENKGNFEIGGSTKPGMSLNLEGDKDFRAGLSPFIGYYVSDNLVLGASANMYHFRNQYSIQTDYSIGPFLKYYFKGNERFRPYVKFQTGFGQHIFDYKDNFYYSDKHKINSVSLSTGMGVSYWIRPSIALTTELNYSYYKLTSEDNSLNLNFGLIFKLGK